MNTVHQSYIILHGIDMKQYILRAEMTASRLCAVAAVIAVSLPSPASVAAVTETVYSVPALRPWKVCFKTVPARRTS